MDKDVANFFNRQASDYHSTRVGMRAYHELIAQRIEAELSGSVLSIGGAWIAAGLPSTKFQLTILDLSEEMLKRWAGPGISLVQGSAQNMPFTPASFDHVVLPLVLHHITGPSGFTAQRAAQEALAQAHRLLKTNGKLWISEFCINPILYGVELFAAPFVRRLLALAKVPLVVMHSAVFYRRALQKLGFQDIRIQTIHPPGVRRTDWIRPIIGIRWLWIPRALYPAHPALLEARRSS